MIISSLLVNYAFEINIKNETGCTQGVFSLARTID